MLKIGGKIKMIKNALLYMKNNISKSILLFVIMAVIANLVIAGLAIKSGTEKAMADLQSSLGNDVTLATNFRNTMDKRQAGQAISEATTSLTITDAEKLTKLKYVDSYNYNITLNTSSSSITAIATETMTPPDNGDSSSSSNSSATTQTTNLSINANTTMKYLEEFTDGGYTITSGRKLTTKDSGTTNAVISSDLAEENNLSVGSTFTVSTTVNNETVTVTLTVVGIFEVGENVQVGGPGGNPVNTVYTDLSVGQTLSGSTTNISSATYYLDDPAHSDAFVAAAKKISSIDWDTFTLDSNDQLYEQNVSNLTNIKNFANMFLAVVLIAGTAILGLILILTIKNRFYEFGILLSMGQEKIKIIGQQLIEIGLIASLAFILSIGTGKLMANSISSMLESNTTSETRNNTSSSSSSSSSSDSSSSSTKSSSSSSSNMPSLNNAFKSLTSTELDVSITGPTVLKLAGATALVSVVSVILPSIYVLRLSPREILGRRE